MTPDPKFHAKLPREETDDPGNYIAEMHWTDILDDRMFEDDPRAAPPMPFIRLAGAPPRHSGTGSSGAECADFAFGTGTPRVHKRQATKKRGIS